MNVLSLFDGISCGRLALERENFEIDNFFASEIDSSAIRVTTKHFPETIKLGDVTNIDGFNLPKIDLLIGGTPCQGFSFAGKQLNFEDQRSKLFFEFVRIKNEVNPKYFLLENVVMSQKSTDIISEFLGVKPIKINSSLFSAQIRKRLYWTNIQFDKNIIDKNISLQDILEKGDHLKEYKVNKTKSREIMWNGKCPNITNKKKSNALTTKQDRWGNAGLIEYEDFCRYLTPVECERLQTIPDNYTSCLPKTQRYKVLGNCWTVDVISHIFRGIK